MKAMADTETLPATTSDSYRIQASAILIDPRNRTITKSDSYRITDDSHDTLVNQIYVQQDGDHDDYLSAVDQSGVCSVIVASDCGFIIRFDGKKFIVPGCAMVERIWCHGNLDRMDTPYEVTDFVMSKTEVKGRFAIEWI